MKVTILDITAVNDKLVFKIRGDFKAGVPYIWQLRAIDRDQFYRPLVYSYYDYSFSTEEKETMFSVSLREIFEDLRVDSDHVQYLEVVVKDVDNTEVKVSYTGQFAGECVYSDENVRMNIGRRRVFALYFQWIPICVQVEKLDVVEKDICLSLGKNFDNETGTMFLQRRIRRDIVYMDEEKIVDLQEDGTYKIALSDLVDERLERRTVYQFKYRVKMPEGYLLSVPVICNMSKAAKWSVRQGDCNYVVKFLQSEEEFFCIDIKKIMEELPAEIEADRSGIVVVKTLKAIQKLVLIRKEETRVLPDMEYGAYENEICEVVGNVIDLETFPETFRGITYQLRAVQNGRSMKIVTAAENERNLKVGGMYVRITESKKGVFIYTETSENYAIPIIMLGSSISGRMMSKAKNPDYRKLFRVVDEYYWPSLFCMAEGSVQTPKNWKITANDAIKAQEQDFSEDADTIEETREPEEARKEPEETEPERVQKVFFEELSGKRFEYLILDLFTDAAYGPRQIGAGAFVGYSGFTEEIYAQYAVTDSKRYFLNENEYFEQWKKAVQVFMQKLLTVVPQHRIILVNGGFAAYYWYDSEKRLFHDSILEDMQLERGMLAARAELWNRMNAYLAANYPFVMILDTAEYDYGVESSEGRFLSPYEFEDNMYRTQLSELTKLILWDKCKNKK